MSRPRAFDPDEALDKAMHAFWRKGFGATSMTELTEATGVGRQSLYNTFGDKQGLFLAALERYVAATRAVVRDHLLAGDGGIEAIRAHLLAAIARRTSGAGPRCCLAALSALERADDDETRRGVRAVFAIVEDAFVQALVAGMQRGEITTGKSPRELARFLVMSVNGLGVLAAAGTSRAALEPLVDSIVRALRP